MLIVAVVPYDRLADVRRERAGAEDLAGLVGRGGDDRQTDRQPGRVGGGRGQLAEPVGRGHELGQPGRVDRRRGPFPVAGFAQRHGA